SVSGSGTSAPLSSFIPRLSAILVVTGWIWTPIQPRPACGPLSLAFAADAVGSIDWPEPPGPRRSAAAAKLAPVARRTRRRAKRARSSLARGLIIVSPLIHGAAGAVLGG